MLKLLNIPFLVFLICWSSSAQETANKKIEDSISYYLNQTLYLSNKGHTSEAISQANKAFQLAKKIKNDKLIGSSYAYFAAVYKKTKDYKNAEIYYKKRIAQLKKLDNNTGALSANYNGYGDLLAKMNKDNEAIKYFNKAIELAQLSKNKFHESSASINLSDFYLSKKKYDLARIHSYRAYNLSIGLGANHNKKFVKQLKGFSSEIIGISELYLNNFDKGDFYLKEAMPFFEKDSVHEHIAKIHLSYFDYYDRNKNIKKALIHHKKYVFHLKKNQEFILKNKSKQIKELSKLEDNILKLELAQKEIKLQKEIKKRLIYFLMFALISTIALIFISFILKRKNKFLKALKEEAIKSSTKKSQFIDMITHELKTPLYTILGSSNILSDEIDSETKKTKHLNSLNSAANYLLNLVNNILNLSKFEANELELEESDFNFFEMIHRIIDVYELKFKENKNKLHLSIDESITKILYGDSSKISQILINLISNANKFTKGGDIWVSAKLIESADGFAFINFTIKDNGIGISNSKQNTIFQEFSDTSQSIDKEYQGTGLGLSIVKRLVNLFDSKIILESKENEGTTFSFVLKLKEVTTSKNDEDTNDFSFLKEKSILVVEDNKINQMITAKTLKKIGVICDTADNGQIAVNKFEDITSNYDAILMDLHMPVMNGFDATLKIRERDTTIPIVALTAVNVDKDPENLKKLGLTDAMNKPFKVDILYTTLIKHLKECMTDIY